jgi:RNA polymerase sigma factor (sigma-70 family)
VKLPMPDPDPKEWQASDSELLRRCAQGDSEALVELYRRHGDTIHRYLARWMGSRSADVEDALQQVFVVAWARASSFRARGDDAGEVKRWLYGISTNVVREHRRRRTARLRAIQRLSDLPMPGSPALDDVLSHRQLAQRAIDGLEELSDPLREAYLLCDVEGLSGADAARVLRIRPGTLRRRLHEARKRLRSMLTKGETDDR